MIFSIRLTREEILSCLRRGLNRKASRGLADGADSAAAAHGRLLPGGLYPVRCSKRHVAGDRHRRRGGVRADAGAAGAFYPPSGQKQAEMDKCLRLRIYDHGIGFGDDEQFRFFKYREMSRQGV